MVLPSPCSTGALKAGATNSDKSAQQEQDPSPSTTAVTATDPPTEVETTTAATTTAADADGEDEQQYWGDPSAEDDYFDEHDDSYDYDDDGWNGSNPEYEAEDDEEDDYDKEPDYSGPCWFYYETGDCDNRSCPWSHETTKAKKGAAAELVTGWS